MKAWNVLIDGKVFDTVFFRDDCDEDYVYITLVDHDGFPSEIEVLEAT